MFTKLIAYTKSCQDITVLIMQRIVQLQFNNLQKAKAPINNAEKHYNQPI